MIKSTIRLALASCLVSAGLLLSFFAQAELSVSRGSDAGSGGFAGASVPEWSYTVEANQTVQTIAAQFLASGISASRILQHNNLASSAQLKSGDTVRIPLSWLQQQPDPARVSSVSGQVMLLSGRDSRKRPLTSGTLIRVGDEVISHAGSTTIELADGSIVRLSPNSRLAFNRLTRYGKSGMVDTRLRLNDGELETQVEPFVEDGSRFEIETPSAVAAVRGTMFTLKTSAMGTDLRVTDGRVAFGPRGKTRVIPEGYSASVSTSSSGGMNIRRLPPAPEINPIPTMLTRLPESLNWKSNGASRYRVNLFEADTGRWLQSATLDNTEYQLDMLDNGKYEVQLAALDSRGIAGMPGIVDFEVDLQARAAELSAPAPGEAVNDDMPEFRWQLLGQNEVARIEIAEDESFSNVIATSEWAPDQQALPSRPLSPGKYYWRVVTEAGGNSVATSEVRTMVVNGTLPPVRIISVNYVDKQVRVFWEKVDTASEYRLQLSEEPGFRNIIKEAELPDTTAALRLIPGRRYFVRLKALSDGPLESRWGPGRELFLE
ncbi:FecR domain-containing protein [Marinobacter confluentis]|uniref:LysM peptidoglycan-binding domain-containing protein n=1 Tax=Marinobacter confluentis TaxID=1697557 RepID=A0A4Z1C398_9GAMM|nr:FecR domain-containing protein [Marinobacter confluentis]TGN39810.1 LysM peptidoglycan-binding domain-containing protein [Marinobacter confluentis]